MLAVLFMVVVRVRVSVCECMHESGFERSLCTVTEMATKNSIGSVAVEWLVHNLTGIRDNRHGF